MDRLGAGEHGVNGKNQGHVSDTLNSWPAEYWGCGFAFKFTRYYGRDRSRCRGRGKGDRGSGKGGLLGEDLWEGDQSEFDRQQNQKHVVFFPE